MPFVSVIIPTHNRPDMLADALASVKAQTFTDHEIVVVSNGENAEARERSRAAAEHFGARYLWLNDGNVSVARNHGVLLAMGEWIAFLDDDDLWLPEKLEYQIEAAYATGADMIACDYVELYPDGCTTLMQPRLPQEFNHHKALAWMRWRAASSSVMLRRAAFRQAGGFDPKQRVTEDDELWRRIAWQYSIVQVNEPLMRYRQGHASMTKNVWRRFLGNARILFKSRFDTPEDLRHELPPLVRTLWQRFDGLMMPAVLPILLPKRLRQPFHPARLRRRWQRVKSLAATFF
jgi:glycosyltransferase involved in cell wall biosynthesis